MLEIIGYFASALVGISLGLIGGGGSILTVPVLVYLFHVDAVLATSYSLFIVGTTSLVGAFPKFRQGLIDVRTALVFGIPSIAAVYLTRLLLVPAIPATVFTVGNLEVTKSIFMLLLFAVLMVAAAYSMIRKNGKAVSDVPKEARTYNYPLILLEGIIVGTLTGLVGAGGGFLIIPALVLLSNLPMKEAVGTSLLIIAAKSLIGFMGDIGHYELDWVLLLSVTLIAVIGIFIGNRMTRRFDGEKLKKGFGWFVLLTGVYIIVKEIWFK
ncbi:MAG: sulfite exporter TauE/SafE family protein [Bacteroidia bacterium]|nr:sulfite exporter TauE/SafE family protein [Bacteroidia bacterium]